MAVEDVLPTLLVIGLIYLFFKWLTKGTNPDGSIPGVTPSMVETVHSAFPDIPLSNIVYHLTKTRSVQATSEEILERGFLPSAPTNYTIPPSLIPPNVNPPSTPNSPTRPESSTSTSVNAAAKAQASLIERYGLKARIPSLKGKEKEDEADRASNAASTSPPGTESKGKWEDTREARERGLKERKERMILEARRRLLEKQAQGETAT